MKLGVIFQFAGACEYTLHIACLEEIMTFTKRTKKSVLPVSTVEMNYSNGNILSHITEIKLGTGQYYNLTWNYLKPVLTRT